MSRIYDALQKAEAERREDTEANHEDASLGPASRDRRSVDLASALSVTGLEDLDYPRSAFAESESYESVPTSATSFDLESVPVTTWSPSLAQLPALQDRGPAVEQFRSLRSRLYELREARPIKTLLITSGLPQEGKSFVAANLAISLARNKSGRVLLIDGDMRRYTVHQLLGCDSAPGLADFLAGRSSLIEVIQRNVANPTAARPMAASGTLVEATAMPPLAFIAGGNGGDRAADLSNNNRFEELISALAPLFDWIVVDSSPVLPVSDAVNLSRACDGVLIVARSGVTQFEDLQRTQAELKAANVLGVVLNAVTDAVHTGGYYGYGYGHERGLQPS